MSFVEKVKKNVQVEVYQCSLCKKELSESLIRDHKVKHQSLQSVMIDRMHFEYFPTKEALTKYTRYFWDEKISINKLWTGPGYYGIETMSGRIITKATFLRETSEKLNLLE